MRTLNSARLLGLALGLAAFAGYACTSPVTGFQDGSKGSFGSSSSSGGSSSGGSSSASASSADGGVTAAASPSSRRIRRLSVEEYTNTLNDLLGTTTNYGAVLPADPVTNGFDDDADSLEVDQLFADEARINAETIAAAFDTNAIGCSPSAGDLCATQFVTSFGQKALRRPLTSAEVTAYVQLFDTVSQASDAVTGIRAILEAMLQSAGFLYRTELGADMTGANVALTPWEVASELSYLFWRTMPDAELIQHAQAGDITQPSVVATEVTRLLTDPRGNRMLDAFADQWLESNLLPYAEKDPTTFPTFTPQVATDMAGEIHAVFESSARDPSGTLASMLTSPTSYLTQNLAQFYGVTLGSGAQVNGFTQTTMPPERAGLLSLGGLLATQSTPLAGNPVRRGKLVRTQLLCQPIPPPPSGLAATVPPLDPNTANKSTWEQHAANPSCSPCHNQMDPIGFAFDAFDAVGRSMTGTIDSTGDIIGTTSTNVTFDGGVDLQTKLAASPDVQTCFVTQWLRFGLGVSDSTASTAEVTRIVGTFPTGGAGVQGILTAITQAPYFYQRTSEVIPAN